MNITPNIGIQITAEDGITAQPYATIYQNLAGEMLAIDDSLTFSPSSPANNMCTAIATIADEAQKACLILHSNRNYLDAEGEDLDIDAKNNGVERRGATTTLQYITVVTTGVATLDGKTETSPFTVATRFGEQFQLVDTVEISEAGSYRLLFESVNTGLLNISLETITEIVTPIDNVASVINYETALRVGYARETDVSVRDRITVSRNVRSIKEVTWLQTQLLNIASITYAKVVDTNQFPQIGVPEGVCYVVVNPGANSVELANCVATYCTIGTPTYSLTDPKTQGVADDSNVVYYDEYITSNIYVNITMTKIDTWDDTLALKTHLVNNVLFDVGESAEQSLITQKAEDLLGKNGAIQTCGVSLTNSGFTPSITATNARTQFTLSLDKITITIL